jgi:hypothetical protein
MPTTHPTTLPMTAGSGSGGSTVFVVSGLAGEVILAVSVAVVLVEVAEGVRTAGVDSGDERSAMASAGLKISLSVILR